MKYILFLVCTLFSTDYLWSQSIIGVWKNIDDEDGKEKSHIEIYEKNGRIFGKVITLLSNATLKTCNKCTGENQGKDIVGMNILYDLQKSGIIWDKGKILNPKNGKIYDCKIEIIDQNSIKVRGYIGVSMFGKSQIWYKVDK